MDEARRWKRAGEPVLWFREDRQVGKEYITRDTAFLVSPMPPYVGQTRSPRVG